MAPGSNPRSMAVMRLKLRIMSAAPVDSTIATATSATISHDRFRRDNVPPAPLPWSTGARTFARDNRQAGARPKTMPDTAESVTENASTRRLSVAGAFSGSVIGMFATRNASDQRERKMPATPPRPASTRLSVSN